MELHSLKSAARADARKRRKRAAADLPDAAERAARVFSATITIDDGDIVAVYRAIQSELDPAPLLADLWQRDIAVCFPVVVAPDTPLEFRQAGRETSFVPGAFGAAIPAEGSAVVRPTVIVAPLLSFDRRGFRLGYGGGFYDRTLELLRTDAPTRAYGYAYAAQEVDDVPIEPTDQRLDGVVTEAGLIRPSAA